MELIEITNKAGKIKLNDIVMQPVMDRLISEIGKIFGANAAESGQYTGELTNFAENAVDTLDIEIHSPGGSVLDGYMLYTEIKKMQSRGVVVTATINSLAASMASVIAMAADKIRMVPQGQMMIHDVQTGVRGNAQELRKQADLIDGMSDEIATIYAARTGKEVSNMRAKMKEETWMTAKVALADGFIDEIYDPSAAKEKTNSGFDSQGKGMNGFLSKLFPGNDEALKVEASIAENDSLRVELTSAQAKITELTGLAEVNAQLQSDLSGSQTKVADLEAKATADAAKIAELTAAAEVSTEKVSVRASELLATQGHPAPVNLTGDSGTTGTDYVAELGKLQGAERSKYYNDNKAEIRKALNKS